MSKEFKAHIPAPVSAPGKSARRAPATPETPPRRIGPADLAAAAKAKAETGDTANEKGRQDKPQEIGGPEGPEPTRYGDWERKGICVDF